MKLVCSLSTKLLLPLAITLALPAMADTAKPVTVPGDRAFTESITAGPDGTLYISSLASGGVLRIKPGATSAEPWIVPGAYETRSTFGVYADAKTSTLWACSNDVSAFGIPGPSSTPGSYLVAFDLNSGEGKSRYKMPGTATLCNDMALSDDGTLYVTNTAAPQIFRLKPGAKELELFVEDAQMQTSKDPAVDGIAFGSDGNIYVNTYGLGEFFRIAVKDGKAGAVTKLKPSRPLKFPDGLRHLEGQTFLMVEAGGTLDRVTIEGDDVKVETLKDGLDGPAALIKVGDTIWVAEGKHSHLFAPKENGPPALPFHVLPIPFGK